ncbi:uncharacterized protein LOC105288073 isoform X6 [Ooceraea biroi]|uniref:uncharacterized protein LOC105288073 isoform X6 n=1 Tax=Ooceraea biroi TaxID=2015173 RepID=UPI0005BD4C1E|nr:uncharacterized protein LOC105288073 isoform X6 [Ooceraea biroi]
MVSTQQRHPYSRIQKELDNITEQVMQQIRIEHPTHPIFSVPHEQLSFWKYNNIDKNQLNNNDGKQILNILCKILSQLFPFESFQGFYIEHSAKCCYRNSNFYIEHVRIDYLVLQLAFSITLAHLFKGFSNGHIKYRWMLELQHFVKPDDVIMIRELSFVYARRKISLSNITSLQKNY